MTAGRAAYRSGTFVMSCGMVVLGVIALVRTVLAGGGGIAFGYVLGVGLVTLGILRLVLLRRTG
jgi:hypothetical protein